MHMWVRSSYKGNVRTHDSTTHGRCRLFTAHGCCAMYVGDNIRDRPLQDTLTRHSHGAATGAETLESAVGCVPLERVHVSVLNSSILY